MAKYLIFANGTQEEFTDSSTITNLFTVVDSYAAIDAMEANFTEENLNGATFDGESLENIVPVKCVAENNYPDSNVITLNFQNRYKTDVEILQEQMVEVQDAIAELS